MMRCHVCSYFLAAPCEHPVFLVPTWLISPLPVVVSCANGRDLARRFQRLLCTGSLVRAQRTKHHRRSPTQRRRSESVRLSPVHRLRLRFSPSPRASYYCSLAGARRSVTPEDVCSCIVAAAPAWSHRRFRCITSCSLPLPLLLLTTAAAIAAALTHRLVPRQPADIPAAGAAATRFRHTDASRRACIGGVRCTATTAVRGESTILLLRCSWVSRRASGSHWSLLHRRRQSALQIRGAPDVSARLQCLPLHSVAAR